MSHVEVTRHSDAERKERRRQLHVRRRRALLWRPLAFVGTLLLIWQVTSQFPIPLLLIVGILMVLPWMVDC